MGFKDRATGVLFAVYFTVFTLAILFPIIGIALSLSGGSRGRRRNVTKVQLDFTYSTATKVTLNALDLLSFDTHFLPSNTTYRISIYFVAACAYPLNNAPSREIACRMFPAWRSLSSSLPTLIQYLDENILHNRPASSLATYLTGTSTPVPNTNTMGPVTFAILGILAYLPGIWLLGAEVPDRSIVYLVCGLVPFVCLIGIALGAGAWTEVLSRRLRDDFMRIAADSGGMVSRVQRGRHVFGLLWASIAVLVCLLVAPLIWMRWERSRKAAAVNNNNKNNNDNNNTNTNTDAMDRLYHEPWDGTAAAEKGIAQSNHTEISRAGPAPATDYHENRPYFEPRNGPNEKAGLKNSSAPIDNDKKDNDQGLATEDDPGTWIGRAVRRTTFGAA